MKLEEEVRRYSKKNGYPIKEFTLLCCKCGCKEFLLYSDANEGGAVAVCSKCEEEIDVEDSRSYIEDAEQNICNCDNERLLFGVGKAFFEGTIDPRWIYVGAECNQCGLVGVYVDWKES